MTAGPALAVGKGAAGSPSSRLTDPATLPSASGHPWYNNLTGGPVRSDWMASIPDNTSLGRLSIPGTHDTLAIRGGPISQTQEDFGPSAQTLSQQLAYGIRAIDIRVRVIDGKFTIHHGLYYQDANFSDVLRVIGSFLNSHPNETVLMRLKAECTGRSSSCTDAPSSTNDKDRAKVFQSYLNDDPNARKYFWAPSVAGDHAAGTPKLGDTRGKIVLVDFRRPFEGFLGKDGAVDTNECLSCGYGLAQARFPRYIQDDYEVPTVYDIGKKWEKVRNQLVTTNRDNLNTLYFNYTSGSSSRGLAHPWTVAGGYPLGDYKGVNQYTYDYLRSDNETIKSGVMMMDFPGAGLIGTITDFNFAGPIVGPGGKCVDVAGSNTANGTPVQLYDCNRTKAQNWTPARDFSLQALGKCLDVYNGGTTPGTAVQLYDCNGTGAQKWSITGSGAIVNPQSGLCLDLPGGNTANRTHLQVWTCNGRPESQKWTVTAPLAQASSRTASMSSSGGPPSHTALRVRHP